MIHRSHHHARLATLFIVAGTVSFASCGGSGEEAQEAPATAPAAPAGPTEPVDGPTLIAPSSRGTFMAEITPKGGPIPTNEPFNVRLVVKDAASGAPLTGADAISLDARMPAHDHGMLRDVELKATDQPGEYLAEGLLFHMIGHWEFHVDVTRGPRMERAQVSTTLSF
ncbi:MAG: FixH family protein [Planctomycetota bacterium]